MVVSRIRYGVAGAKLSHDWDAVAVSQLRPPFAYVVCQVVPSLGVNAQGCSDVVAGTLGLVDLVQSHGSGPSGCCWVHGARNACAGSRTPGVSQARPSGPSCSSSLRCETSRGTLTPVLPISSLATLRKWV